MKDTTKAELIEAVAAAVFRVQALLTLFGAFRGLGNVAFSVYVLETMPSLSPGSDWSKFIHRSVTSFVGTFVCELFVAAILFFLAVPLARFISRGLAPALEPKLSI
jgi:hypothetical protein